MLPTEESPVHQLAASWWAERHCQRFTSSQIAERRLALTEATLQELRLKIAAETRWNPYADARVLWAAAYLSSVENVAWLIDPDLAARAAWHFDPPLALCGKDHAAGAA